MDIIATSEMLKFVLALIFVISLMGGLALIMKRLGYGGTSLPLGKRRLKVIESLAVDSRHRLVLIQRDDVQHLVMTGASGDIVIETNISPRPEENDPQQTT